MKNILIGVATAMMIFCTAPAAAQTSSRPMTSSLKALTTASPFQVNDGAIPPKVDYPGRLFALSAAWPAQALPPLTAAPWQAAIGNGTINTRNAAAYAAALKAAVAVNGRALIRHGDGWDAAKAHWYTEPWLGSQRDAIRGTYSAGAFAPAIFPGTGLRTTFGTHVLTYYDERAAYTLRKVWGAEAIEPAVTTANMQLAEGSIIVKAAVFAPVDGRKPGWWDAMAGAQVWPLYLQVQVNAPHQVVDGYVAQFDIIVKDSQSSPLTGWVFMTLVYDVAASGDVWDRMVPLGVQWGNDPHADRPGVPLTENWINPAAPKYATQTLGWGGRLSGPNDGALNDIAVGGKVIRNAPDSSCMSCHSTAQWNVDAHKMPSFLLPSFPSSASWNFQMCGADGRPKPAPTGKDDIVCSPPPGSVAWMTWFQDRLGTEPMDSGAIAADFDEVLSFKSLKNWWLAGPATRQTPGLLGVASDPTRFNQYTGAPLKAVAVGPARRK